MSFCVYVAAPFSDAGVVRVVHDRLGTLGIVPTSRWVDQASGAEDFARFEPSRLRAIAAQNDADLRGSDALLVLARAGAGGEMFAEARVGLDWGKAVVWVGRRILSAWRSGVVLVEDVDDAFPVLSAMRERHAEGHRGHLLAHLAGSAA